MNTKQSYRTFIFTLSKWIVFGILIGLIIGSTTALLLSVNDLIGETREKN
ncbi:hypothetical protein SAMN05192533_101256 [Mesobacillus persicus]|uniref:Uncharacterized protein n=1 Tax=Mesobacillus persicus TaxID=930146 RepID=A0A1H7W3M7_9BACI|nr:hypothetical protein [Mesobacillus persicus]SEM16143.1 hypothetical protein SAMN05192533_101256 [Mesobacillus persicus]